MQSANPFHALRSASARSGAIAAALSAPLVEQLVQGGMAAPDAAALWAPGGKNYVEWARALFFIPAIAGGVFGLLEALGGGGGGGGGDEVAKNCTVSGGGCTSSTWMRE